MMAKPLKNDGTATASVLSAEEKTSAVTVAGVPDAEGAEDTTDNVDSDAPREEEDDALLVVVCKGHTLYHDGNKYPQSYRLRMSADAAARLLKRGVVVKYDDLLKKVSEHGG